MTKRKKNIVRARAEDFIAKIEGHGSLSVDFKRGSVALHVHEGERLFEGILVGRTLEEMHWITPRICGVCPIAHNLASLRAAETALGVQVTQSTELLRRLMQIGQNVQSHVLHAVFLALPDYIGLDNAVELDAKDPVRFKSALILKETGDEIAQIVAGRSVHPTRTTLGGFHKVPTPEELKGLKARVEVAVKEAHSMADLFASLEYPELKVDLEFLSIDGSDVLSNMGESFDVSDYKENIAEEVRKNSTAKFGSFRGGTVMVGALARLERSHRAVPTSEPKLDRIDYQNPFHNNLAQITEVFFELRSALDLIDELLSEGIDDSIAPPAKNPSGRGIGAIEAPRGGLYNEVAVGGDSIIRYANIVTPTVQNLTSIEATATALLQEYSSKPQKEVEKLLEMLVRAYDPCITCSAH